MTLPTILVTDDSPDIRRLMSRVLTPYGYHVVEASNGLDAVRLARRCQPALILLDLCLPGLHGLDVASQIRADPALEETPIIAMTGYASQAAIRSARLAGCRSVVSKPFDIDEITREVMALAAPAGDAPTNA